MIININRKILIEKLGQCLKFTAEKSLNNSLLRGILIKGEEETLDIYATNLSFFIHTTIDLTTKIEKFQAIIEPVDLIEYLSCAESEMVVFEIKENTLRISQEKSQGTFPLISGEDFPLPPGIKGKGMAVDVKSLRKSIPLLLLSASKDNSRPVLTSVNFIVEGDKLTMVSTDGFRLSVVQEKATSGLHSMLISAEFLNNVLQMVKDKNLTTFYLPEEKIAAFQIDKTTLYTRLIEGDFPPYEKAIPTDKKTTALVERETFLKNIRQMAVFVKNRGGIIILNIKKDSIKISPKNTGKDVNYTVMEGIIDGDEQRIAFNYRFLVDLLNHLEGEKIIIEMLRSDTPVLFRDESRKNFFHIIMPVRISE